MADQLRRRYVNLRMKGSFGGITNVSRATKIGVSSVRKELSKIPTYTLHKPIRLKFPRRRVYAAGINDQWVIDLADIQSISGSNNRKRYILCAIDVFSKRGWLEAVSNKSGPVIAKAFEKIFIRSGQRPRKIQVDKGKEFYNRHVKSLLKHHNIKLFSVESDKKACIAERFIRTIKGLIWRYMTCKKTKRFVDRLTDFENLYNKSYHRSIKMAPNDVTPEKEELVRANLYGNDQPFLYTASLFKVGDHVLVAKRKTIFEKGYTQNYLSQLFVVSGIRESIPQMYFLKTKSGTIVKEAFYAQQLQKVDHS
jgi:transposase-like protein